ncbi:hypothetical protein ABPG75_008385 [Micractinium tetrahymenae]
MQEQASIEPPEAAQQQGERRKTGAHLLRHQVTPEVAAAAAAEFGDDQLKAGEAILKLRQPELRSVFERVYSVTTGSGNNDWMRSKLLQAVGLSTRWRPEQPPADKGETEAAAAAATENGRAKRARRVPAALQGTLYGEQPEDGSPARPASAAPAPKRSKAGPSASGAAKPGRQDSTAGGGGSAGGATTASDGAAGTNGGATSVTQGPPMVVVSDPQVPAWPSFMPLPPTAAAQGGTPFVQAEERHVREQRAMVGQQAPQARAQQPQLTAQQAQQVQQAAQAAQLAALRPLAVEDVVVPLEQPGGADAQQAVWSLLQSAGMLPDWAQLAPLAQPPSRPPSALPTSQPPSRPPSALPTSQPLQPPSGVWIGGGAAAHPPPQSVTAPAVAAQRSQFPSSAASPAASIGGPTPSPFAAEAAVPLPTAKEPAAAEAEQVARHPLASLLQGDLSLMGLAALAEEGGLGLSSVLPTASTDLHKLFGAWQEGRVSLSLSRRDLPGLAAAPAGQPQPQGQPPEAPPPREQQQ